MRATRWSRSLSVHASPARRLSRSAPTRGSPPSVSGAVLPTPASRRSCRPNARCLPAHDGEPKTDAQREAQAARERCKTEAGVWAHKRRMADAEGAVAELKNEHGLDRARGRGTPLFHAQLLLGCTALNLKRLASHVGEAASGAAARPHNGRAIALDAHAGDPAAHESIHHRSITPTGLQGLADTRVTVPTWTITLSMN